MKRIFAVLVSTLIASLGSSAHAQSATVRVPMCLLQYQNNQVLTRQFVPCNGVVPVNSATGNAMSWDDLFNKIASPSVTTGNASTTATPVQNTDGSKLATDADMINAVTQLTSVVAKLSTIITNMGTPMQAGGTFGNTSFGASQLGTWNMGVTSLPALTTGAATIGNVNVNGTVPVSGVLTDAQLRASALPISGTVTANLGALNGIATAVKQDALLAALGTPAQAPAAATSVAATGTVSTSAITPTTGSGSFANGSAIVPFSPQLGLPVRLVTRVSSGGTFSAYVGTSIDSCSTINPLTIGGMQWASFVGPADEYVDTPPTTVTQAGIKYCLVITPTSGTVTYGLRQ